MYCVVFSCGVCGVLCVHVCACVVVVRMCVVVWLCILLCRYACLMKQYPLHNYQHTQPPPTSRTNTPPSHIHPPPPTTYTPFTHRAYQLPEPAPRPVPRIITFQRKRANRRIINEERFLDLLREFGEVRVSVCGVCVCWYGGVCQEGEHAVVCVLGLK